MPWIKMRGVTGLVYEPERQPASERKYHCRDCFWCQQCSDTRCDECRRMKAKARSKRRQCKCKKK